MISTNLVDHDVVLVGGGHSHVEVLRRFGMRPVDGVRLTLVAREFLAPYSGMLPGTLSGHYSKVQSHIDLQKLGQFAGARCYLDTVTGIDVESREIYCDGRSPVSFDLVSLDIGSVPDLNGISGADACENVIPVRPVGRFLTEWPRVEQRLLDGDRTFRLVVVGGGAGGVELSLSLQYRLSTLLADRGLPHNRIDVTVVTDESDVLVNYGASTRRRAMRLLRERAIHILTGQRVVACRSGVLECEPEKIISFDAAVVATQGSPAPWLVRTGLELDERGFIRVAETLQSVSHRSVFAAGDIASIDGYQLAKSGVYAVRQGPVLAENLRRACRGDPLRVYRPQNRHLSLISEGSKRSIASYGALSWEGAWVWRVKDWIDRRWMRKYQVLPDMAGMTPEHGADSESLTGMRCGGCGAKVASSILRRVIERIKTVDRPDVLVGLDDSDDASALTVPKDRVLLQSVDHFRPFIDDPYLFGRIAAIHCLGDLYAMGAEPQSAQALVTLAYNRPEKIEQELYQLLSGAVESLTEAGVALVGGHSAEGAETMFGLSVNGLARRDELLRKSGLVAGDVLLLTKPVGTGVIFAANMRAKAATDFVQAAITCMLQSNEAAARCLKAHGASACTDVTGFGLLGHLIEMLGASRTDASLYVDRIPTLPGALELFERGYASSLHPANAVFGEVIAGHSEANAGPAILFDPQTSGGLLAGVPAERAEGCLAALRNAGYEAAVVIGQVTPGEDSGAPRVRLHRGDV